MEAEVDPQLEVVAVGVHEQCVANDHVYDNIGLEGDSVDYSWYNKVVGLNRWQASPRCLG